MMAPTTTTFLLPPAPTLKVGGIKLAVNNSPTRARTATEIFAWSDGSAVSLGVTVREGQTGEQAAQTAEHQPEEGHRLMQLRATPLPHAEGQEVMVWVTTAVTGRSPSQSPPALRSTSPCNWHAMRARGGTAKSQRYTRPMMKPKGPFAPRRARFGGHS